MLNAIAIALTVLLTVPTVVLLCMGLLGLETAFMIMLGKNATVWSLHFGVKRVNVQRIRIRKSNCDV